MKWYWYQAGCHVHVRVFMNGGKCGDLCFRVEEFEQIRREQNAIATIEFIKEERP